MPQFLNFITVDFKRNFENILGHSLNVVQIPELLTYLVLDSSILPGKHVIDTIFIYDNRFPTLSVCNPGSIKLELDNISYENNLGRFNCHAFSGESLVAHDDFFLECLDNIAHSENVRQLLVVGFNERYGKAMEEILKDTTGIDVIQFRMDNPTGLPYRYESIAFPIMKALGINGSELL